MSSAMLGPRLRLRASPRGPQPVRYLRLQMDRARLSGRHTATSKARSARRSFCQSTGVFTTATSQTFLGNTVYASSSDITTATGTSLTFDAQGDPTALFIIRVATYTCDRRGKNETSDRGRFGLHTSLLAIDKEPAKRLGEAASVFSEIMATPDKGIPQDLLDKAHCIVIVPGLKTAAS
jgi:hypothetical protein